MRDDEDELRTLRPARARGEPTSFGFEGSTVRAFEGESLAVALWAADVRTLARSIKYHRPRGAFCFDGHCASCLMRVDGAPNVRACMTPIHAGLSCERQNAFPSAEVDVLAAADWMFPRGMDHHTLMTGNRIANRVFLKMVREIGGSGTLPDQPADRIPPVARTEVDVCVVGGGPAGLAAAAAIAGARPATRVLVVDEQREVGGSWLAEPGGHARARAAGEQARAAGVRLWSSATAIGYYPEDQGGVLAVAGENGLATVKSGAFVCATGGYDQNLPFLNNDRPGVISARGCGRLAFVHGVRPGRRVLVIGPSTYGDRLADGLAAAGVAVERLAADGAEPEAVVYGPPVTALLVRRPDGSRRRVTCDTIVVAATPAPASELARQLGAAVSFDLAAGGFAVQIDERFTTAAPRVFACGDVTGYKGPEAAARAGAHAGAVIANAIAAL